MEHARGDLLSDARRTCDEHPASGPRDTLQRRANIVDRSARTREFVGRSGALAQPFIFEFEPLALGRPCDEVELSLGFERLFDKIEGAAANRSHRCIEPAVPRNDDNRERWIERLDRFYQPQPIEP